VYCCHYWECNLFKKWQKVLSIRPAPDPELVLKAYNLGARSGYSAGKRTQVSRGIDIGVACGVSGFVLTIVKHKPRVIEVGQSVDYVGREERNPTFHRRKRGDMRDPHLAARLIGNLEREVTHITPKFVFVAPGEDGKVRHPVYWMKMTIDLFPIKREGNVPFA